MIPVTLGTQPDTQTAFIQTGTRRKGARSARKIGLIGASFIFAEVAYSSLTSEPVVSAQTRLVSPAEAINRIFRFKTLADRWREETGFLSSLTKILNHPDYLAILQMGRSDPRGVLPLILRELQAGRGFWFDALKQIARESPVTADIRHDSKKVREAWLQWGREKKYLAV